jgi:hypothetical protein
MKPVAQIGRLLRAERVAQPAGGSPRSAWSTFVPEVERSFIAMISKPSTTRIYAKETADARI